MKIIIRGNYRVGKTTMVQELLKEIGPGAGFYTENVGGLVAIHMTHGIIGQRTDGFGGRGKKTGSDIVPLAGQFLGGALLRFLTGLYPCSCSNQPGFSNHKSFCDIVMAELESHPKTAQS